MWRYECDTVLMHGGVQGDIVHMCDEFVVHGKLYVEVIRTCCFMVKYENQNQKYFNNPRKKLFLLQTPDVQTT